ncbi:MAG: cytochrome c1 [Nitratireductor sp.]|nr:cytochrome c1 [Nitratireductor sp.]
MIAFAPAQAAEEEGGTPHYPIEHPKHVHWSFGGPFGHWDIGQLQRGLKVYKEVCSACHSLNLVAFRNLEELGYSEEQVKAFASEYTVTDGPNAEGEMFERAAVPADRFPAPFPNEEAAAYANNGAAPPDFSLLAKARAPERGFPWFIFDVFTLYAENGPDYIYSLLTGYGDAPEGAGVPEGSHYNPYFVGGPTLAMAPPLSDEIVTYDDGSPETVDQYARDIAAFMMWAAEPSLVERKSLGFKVMAALLLLAILFYLSKKAVWSALYNENSSSGGRAAPAMAAVGSAPRAGVDFIDDIELIDGIGATIAKRMKSKGVNSLAKIAAMSVAELDKLGETINAKSRPVREEWQVQARELIAGKPPRAAIDRAKVEKLLGKKF